MFSEHNVLYSNEENFRDEVMLRRQLILGISSGLLVSQGVRAKTVSDLVVLKKENFS